MLVHSAVRGSVVSSVSGREASGWRKTLLAISLRVQGLGWRMGMLSREEQWEQGAVLHGQAAGECSTQGRAQQAQTSTNTLTNLS